MTTASARSAGGRRAHETRRESDRLHHADLDALRFLARAAGLMTDPSATNKGEALYWTGRAVLKIAEGDTDLRAHDRALEIVRRFNSAPGAVVPGPYSGT